MIPAERLDVDTELGLGTVQPGVTFAQVNQELLDRDACFRLLALGSGPHTSVLGNALGRAADLAEQGSHPADLPGFECVPFWADVCALYVETDLLLAPSRGRTPRPELFRRTTGGQRRRLPRVAGRHWCREGGDRSG